MRVFVFAVIAFLFSGAPARAQEEEATAHQLAARLMIEALAPSSHGDWAYDWGPVSARTARHMHWHLFEPDPRDRPDDYVARRNGWIDAPGQDVGVSAFGGERQVTELSFRFDQEDDTGAVLDALRAEGATLELVREGEAFSEFRLNVTERKLVTILSLSECTSPRSAAAQRCWTTYTLRLER
jgi:hypothetical protein